MSRNARPFKIALALAATIAAAGFTLKASAARQDLPEGKGVELARERCIGCHEADLIVSQRLSRPGWVREVEKMVRWGATVNDAEKETLADYFAANFAPRPANKIVAADENQGKQIFESKCLLCHEIDLTQ